MNPDIFGWSQDFKLDGELAEQVLTEQEPAMNIQGNERQMIR